MLGAGEAIAVAGLVLSLFTAVATSSWCMYFCSRNDNQKHTPDNLRVLVSDLESKRKDLKKIQDTAVLSAENEGKLCGLISRADDFCSKMEESVIKKLEYKLNERCMCKLMRNVCGENQARASLEEICSTLKSLIRDAREMLEKPVKGYKLPDVEIVGQERRKEIWDKVSLAEENGPGTICIHGPMGVGKTAIAISIHNQALSHEHDGIFDYVIWVTLEYGDGLQQVQEKIAKELGIDLSKNISKTKTSDSSVGRAWSIEDNLSQKDKFLLVLDSMWQPLSLQEIGIPELQKSRKLIITSRLRNICKKINSECFFFEVEPLPSPKPWELFVTKAKLKALPSKLTDKNVSCTKDVVAGLDGIPSAISKLAETLNSIKEDDYNEFNRTWKKELELAEKPKDQELMKRLIPSYDNLKTDTAKCCFLYCASLPRDYPIRRKELIEYWMLQGLLDNPVKNLQKLREEGIEILNQLKNAHLLHKEGPADGEKFKMLSLVRSMGVYKLATLTQEVNNFPAAVGASIFRPRADLESLTHPLHHDLNFDQVRGLSTLLLQDISLNSNSHDAEFFNTMSSLRFVDLSRSGISTLPSSLSESTQLCALVLRSCRNLRKLPSLSKLQQLIVLDLSGTSLEDCPQGIKNMKNLIWLDLSQTKIATFPAGVVDKLTKLEELLVITNVDWGSRELVPHWQGACVEDLLGLKNLALLELKFLNGEVFTLYVNKVKKQNKVPPKFRFCVGQRLQSGIVAAGENSVSIFGDHCCTLPYTTKELHLMSCRPEKIISQLGEVDKRCLSNLEVLGVYYITGLQYLFPASVFESLKKLRELRVKNCTEMKEIVNPASVEGSDPKIISLPGLSKMLFSHLPNLTSLCGRSGLNCPLLASVEVWSCRCMKLPVFYYDQSDSANSSPHTTIEIKGDSSWMQDDFNDIDGSLIHSDFHPYLKCSFKFVPPPDHSFRPYMMDQEGHSHNYYSSSFRPYMKDQQEGDSHSAMHAPAQNSCSMEIDELEEEQNPVKGNRQSPEVVIVGKMRTQARKEIWEAVSDEAEGRPGTICIHGTLGVGKTAIAISIHNQALEGKLFDHVFWVNVEYGAADILKVQEAIAQSIEIMLPTNNPPAPADEGEKDINADGDDIVVESARELRNALCQRGKFLLVLDSVWQPLSLDNIGIPPLVNGRKLIVTSRIRTVCDYIPNKKAFEILPLPAVEGDKAWEIFSSKMESLPQLKDDTVGRIRRALLVELDGLPLAITAVAQSLGKKQKDCPTDLDQVWGKELDELAKDPTSYLKRCDQNVFKKFEDSYKSLNLKSRSCFLYCALFPKDYLIKSQHLIEYWRLEDLLGDNDTLAKGNNKGREALKELVNAHLLPTETGENVKMLSNLFRSMTIDTMGNENPQQKVFIRSGCSLSKLPSKDNWPPAVKRASFMQNELQDLNLREKPDLPELYTLLLQENNSLVISLDDKVFSSMPNLQVLDLSGTKITALPKSVLELKRLRALLLRNCAHLALPPNLSKLQEVIVLDLSGTPLKRCPEGIQNMSKLRRLDLSQTNLATFPANIVNKLTKLEELLMITARDCIWGSREEKQWKGPCVEDLVKLKKLALLHLHLQNKEAFDKYVNTAKLEYPHAQQTFRFRVGKIQGGKIPLENSILVMLNKQHLLNLNYLDVCNLRGLNHLFTVEMLNSLTQLRELRVRSCKAMLEVVQQHDEDQDKIHLPQLTRMLLFNLPSLKSVCHGDLICPKFVSIGVWSCGAELKLPVILPSSDEIRIIGNDRSWYNNLNPSNRPTFTEEDVPPELITAAATDGLAEQTMHPELAIVATDTYRKNLQGERSEEQPYRYHQPFPWDIYYPPYVTDENPAACCIA